MSDQGDFRIIHQRTGEVIHEARITLRQLADDCGCEITLVEEFLRYGIIEPEAQTAEAPVFPEWMANRVGRAIRLQKDFDLTLDGLGLVLDLLDRIETLEDRLRGMDRG